MFNLNWSVKKWGGLASFLLAVALITSGFIYLTGNLRDAMGSYAYSLADFLAGPVLGVSLITAILALREYFDEKASRRMNLALLASFAAACAFVAIACIRSANRQYHLDHPELHLESVSTVLIVWTTLVAGVTGTAWHFLGWALVLIGSAGWTSGRLPRLLCALYLLAGATSLFVYLLPAMEGNASVLLLVLSIWQGILLLRAKPGKMQMPAMSTNQPDHT